MENYSVYKHTSPSGKVYIGITGRDVKQRWKVDGRGYSHQPTFFNAIKKYGWENIEHEVLSTGLSREEAEAEEIRLIALYDSTNKNFGYNRTLGGDGCNGYVPTEEARVNMSRNHADVSGVRNPMFGKSHSLLTKQKISAKRKQLFAEGVLKQKKKERPPAMSPKELSAFRSANMKGSNNPQYGIGNSVAQYAKDGKFICRYQTIREAERITGVDHTTITRCCKLKQKSAGGFVWKYAEEETKCMI